MKLRSYFYAALCGLALTAGFTSCSDDDDDAVAEEVVVLNQKGFVLNAGKSGQNNATLTYFDGDTHTVYEGDLYYDVNGLQLGDVGEDMIAYGDYLYIAVYKSNYLVKLDIEGNEVARLSFDDYSTLGKPRQLAASNGYIYVSCYGGYVAKVDADALSLVSYVQIGNNPEGILVASDGNIYCVNSGAGYDNRLSIISESAFDEAENVEVFTNPVAIAEANGTIVLQGYGGAYGSYTYPVAVYNKASKTYTTVGTGTYIDTYGDLVYVVECEIDYSVKPYEGTTTVWTYNVSTGEKKENVLDIPETLANACSYGITINQDTGLIYVFLTNYAWDNGAVYYFDQDGTYLGSFDSQGQNPTKVAFLNK